jgi:hypothetical protein
MACQMGKRGEPPVRAPWVDPEKIVATGKQVAHGLGQVARDFFDWYREPPRWDNYEAITGEMRLMETLSMADMQAYGRKIKQLDPEWRRAATAVHAMNFDVDKLVEAVDKAPTTALRRKYQNALALIANPEMHDLIHEGQQFYNTMFDAATAFGVLDDEDFVEDYLNRQWHTRPGEDDLFTSLKAAANAAPLQVNPSFSAHRVIRDLNEAEIERLGYRSNDDYGFRIASYYQGLQRAINARKAVRAYMAATAPDGRPVVSMLGTGTKVGPAAEHAGEAILVDAPRPAAGAWDYKSESQLGAKLPMLRNWKWIEDVDGVPTLMRGEAAIHPDYADRFSTRFASSKIRTGKGPGFSLLRGMMKLSNVYKTSEFALSPFHATTEAEHAMAHAGAGGGGFLNNLKKAFYAPEIPWKDPKLRGLIRGGMMMLDYDANGMFSDSLAGGLKWVPGIGPYQEKYTDDLFNRQIPGIKAWIGMDAFDRNMKRYAGRLSEEQVYKLTARQMNDAFGELDWAGLGVNKTVQDTLRLGFTAPDFNLARIRFLGTGLMPYNAEQRTALMRIGLSSYVTSRIMNKILDNDWHWHDIPFGVKSGDTQYTLRTINQDAEHAYESPRSYVYHRLNGVTLLPFMKTFFGDIHGQQFGGMDVVKDTVGGITPISMRGVMGAVGWSDTDQNIWQAMLSSGGVSAYPYRDPVERQIDQARAKNPVTAETPETITARHAKSRVVDAYRQEKEPRQADLDKLSTNQQISARKMGAKDRFAGKLEGLPFLQLGQAYELAVSKGFDKDAEAILQRFASMNADPFAGVLPADMPQAQKLYEKMRDALADREGSAPPKPDKSEEK